MADISNALQRRMAGLGDGELRLIVRYAPWPRAMRADPEREGVSDVRRFRLWPGAKVCATRQGVEALASDPAVLQVYEDRPVHALLDLAVPHIGAHRVWAQGWTGRGVRVAIVDTGIDPQHPDFAGRVGVLTDFTGQGPRDGNGHGTHCAGIAAGSGQASDGRYCGVAPGATILSAKVLDDAGAGLMSDVMAGVEWAVDQGAQVISLSLGAEGPTDGDDAISEMCDAAVALGVVVCVAAGNEGPGRFTVGCPGGARNVITIGACDDADRVASFSSRGPTADGRAKPDLLMPGVGIIAPRASGTSLGEAVGECYGSLSGTSMATPLAAGLCALLLEAEPGLTPAQIKRRLMDTAVDLGENAYAQGRGRADAWRALRSSSGSLWDKIKSLCLGRKRRWKR